LRSTANDLLRFVEAAMDLKHTPLSPAFAEMLKTQRPADTTDTNAAAGWFVTSGHDDRLVWKNGGILGYASFMGYSITNHKGIVVLADGVTDQTSVLGKHLLNASFPLPR
jgi:D-alanyl-D-alanine-carboxypeptidase/D-alanyl-D-alanine-endopeptidase